MLDFYPNFTRDALTKRSLSAFIFLFAIIKFFWRTIMNLYFQTIVRHKIYIFLKQNRKVECVEQQLVVG